MKNAEIIYSNLELFNKRKLDIEKNFLINFNERVSDFFSSSGRIELLGNHTDHNNGLVLVSSIDLNILALTTPTTDNKISLYSEGFPLLEIDITDLNKKKKE